MKGYLPDDLAGELKNEAGTCAAIAAGGCLAGSIATPGACWPTFMATFGACVKEEVAEIPGEFFDTVRWETDTICRW